MSGSREGTDAALPGTDAELGRAARPDSTCPVRSWEYRRPRLWVGVRVASGVFNFVLGVLLLVSAAWLGPLTWLAVLPLAGAALIFWTVYRLQQDSVRRVRELEHSRAHMVEDSAARLRRIERDLHDGAQAQMVAVAMKLGLAREKLDDALNGAARPGPRHPPVGARPRPRHRAHHPHRAQRRNG